MSADQHRPQNTQPRRYRAGEMIEDYCRACQSDRMHNVMAADANGRPIRVVCGFCSSEHNYRGGPRTGGGASVPSGAGPAAPRRDERATLSRLTPPPRASSEPPLPLVSERERVAPPVSFSSLSSSSGSASGPSADLEGLPDVQDDHAMDLELLLRRIIREESGLTAAVPADKWRGGELVLRPGKAGVQEKTWPIDTFFHKIVMVRNRLRTLEQQVNASDLPDDVKVKLQTYVTGCYGTLTSFNVLFADEDDQFKGAGE